MYDATAAMPSAPPQHIRALQHANEVRLARAQLKRDVSKGAIPVGQVILHSPWEAATMTIGELLTSQRHWGTARCSKFLASIEMSETKTVESMTERQRGLLARMIDPPVAGVAEG
jgi:hypothetical protein